MPKVGDNYIIELKEPHIKWGSHRNTNSRKTIKGEAYFPIPRKEAKKLDIYNSNKSNSNNIYKVSTSDGYLEDADFKAQGSMRKGDIYAKQLSGLGNLKKLGDWYKYSGCKKGDKIKVEFKSSTNILISKESE